MTAWRLSMAVALGLSLEPMAIWCHCAAPVFKETNNHAVNHTVNSISLGRGVTIIVTAEQKAQFNEVISQHNAGIKAVNDNRQLSAAEKQARVDELRANADARVRQMLSPEDYKKYADAVLRTQSLENESNRKLSRAGQSPPKKATTPSVASPAPRTPIAGTPLKVQGLIYREGNPVVIVSGEFLTVSNWIGKAQIISITQSNIVLQEENQQRTTHSIDTR